MEYFGSESTIALFSYFPELYNKTEIITVLEGYNITHETGNYNPKNFQKLSIEYLKAIQDKLYKYLKPYIK